MFKGQIEDDFRNHIPVPPLRLGGPEGTLGYFPAAVRL